MERITGQLDDYADVDDHSTRQHSFERSHELFDVQKSSTRDRAHSLLPRSQTTETDKQPSLGIGLAMESALVDKAAMDRDMALGDAGPGLGSALDGTAENINALNAKSLAGEGSHSFESPGF